MHNLQEFPRTHKKIKQSKSRQIGQDIDPNYFQHMLHHSSNKNETRSTQGAEADDNRSAKKVKTLTMQGSEIGSACDKSVSSEQNDDRAPVTIYARQKDGTVTKMEHGQSALGFSSSIPTME